jgi:hypothetical protein
MRTRVGVRRMLSATLPPCTRFIATAFPPFGADCRTSVVCVCMCVCCVCVCVAKDREREDTGQEGGGARRGERRARGVSLSNMNKGGC